VGLDGGGWVEVAPRDREGLLAELAERCRHLRATPRGLADPRRTRRAPPAPERARRRR
jgi:hypothetical protein